VKGNKEIEVVLSSHVIGRMRYRSITEEEIISVLTSPERTEKADHGFTAFYKKVSNRKIKVVAKKRGNKYYVLTAFPE
jgi:hypothetical protein